MSKEIIEKLTDIQVNLAEVKTEVKGNTKSLDYHIRRTDLLERCLNKHEKRGHIYKKDLVVIITVVGTLSGIIWTISRFL